MIEYTNRRLASRSVPYCWLLLQDNLRLHKIVTPRFRFWLKVVCRHVVLNLNHFIKVCFLNSLIFKAKMALHVPKAPGFSQMLKEGARVSDY